MRFKALVIDLADHLSETLGAETVRLCEGFGIRSKLP